MKRYKKTFDKEHKVTRILLADYLALKRISQATGISMAEALHRLIEHQAQLPLPDFRVTGMPAIGVTGKPAVRVAGMSAVRIAPVTTIATNGSKAAAFRIQPKGVRRD